MIFSKYEGAGNDFILIDDRPLCFPIHDAHFIKRMCHRRFGIGADGIVLLQPDSHADFRMRIFNSDGSEAEGCGNGTRCLMRFIADLGLPQKLTRIAIYDRILEADFVGNGIGVAMGEMRDIQLHLQIAHHEVHSVDSGVPHAVSFVPDIEAVNLSELGPFLRHHPTFGPRGTNVNIAALQNDGAIRVRTFERGVEGETFACGTGAAAVATIASCLYQLPSPVRIRFKGGDLAIHFDDSLKNVKMVGPAVKVFEGAIP